MTELSNNVLRRKAFGIMKSIEAMNEKERAARPSQSFGANYNRLRELCLVTNPDLSDLLPPTVGFENYGHEGYTHMLTEHNFSEIHTFCSELYHLLE